MATEAVEILGGRGAASAESAIEREASQVERSVTKEAESNNSWRSRRIRPRHNSFDDNDEEETSDEPQIYRVSCSQCGGSGAVYMLDYYGNVQYDLYGNPMVSPCSYCGGAGTILVSE